MEEATFVIIGGGIAGVSCAETLGYLNPEEKLILLTASPVVKAVTNVVPLTKMLTKFDVIEKSPETFANSQPSLKIIDDLVISINSSEHTVATSSGLIVKYKKLCICSGGTPKLFTSSCNEYVIGIRDTESVSNFQTRIKTARRIIVVGNGGIATELVYELSGVEVIWAVKDTYISAPFIDAGAAEFFQQKLLLGKGGQKEQEDHPFIKRTCYSVSTDGCDSRSKGGAALGPDWHTNCDLQGSLHEKLKNSHVTVEYKCEVENIKTGSNDRLSSDPNEPNWPVYVKLTNGKVYGCDFIVSATGVVPNSKFQMDDGKTLDISEDEGIKVDEYMMTNLKDVFAAGDVCMAGWNYADHWFQMRLWTQAHQMGCYVAKSMSASLNGVAIFQDFCFELFTHVTNFFGFKVVLLGLFNGQKLNGNYCCQLRVTPGVEYIKLVMKNGKMQGAVLIGDTDIEEMCENLILNQLDVTDIENDLLDPDIDIDDYFD